MEMEWYERLNEVLQHVEKNLSGQIDYNDVSRLSLCNANLLQQFFILNTGVTLTEYIRRRRISEAAREIQNPGSKMTITDIAFKYGYDSSDAFRVAFKRYYNIAPQEARRSEIILKPYPQLSFKLIIQYGNGADFMNDVKELTGKIEQEPRNAELFYKRAEAYFGLKEYEKALFDCTKAIELGTDESNIINYLNLRGASYFQLKEYTKATFDLSKALESATEDMDALSEEIIAGETDTALLKNLYDMTAKVANMAAEAAKAVAEASAAINETVEARKTENTIDAAFRNEVLDTTDKISTIERKIQEAAAKAMDAANLIQKIDAGVVY